MSNTDTPDGEESERREADRSHEAAIASALTRLSDTEPTYLLDPADLELRGFVRAANTVPADSRPSVRLLGRPEMLSAYRGEFVAASVAANLVEAGDLRLRRYTGPRRSTVFVGPERTEVIVGTRRRVVCQSVTGSSLTTDLRADCRAQWENARTVALETPARDRTIGTLRDWFGDAVADDFAEMVTIADDEFDPVTAATLVAAKHGLRNRRLTEWVRDVGLASPSTVSDRKARLLRHGVLETEQLPESRTHRLDLTGEVAHDPDPERLAHLVDRVSRN